MHIRYVDIVIHRTTIGIIGFPLYFSLFALLGFIIEYNPIKKYLGMMVTNVTRPSLNQLNNFMLPPPYSLL